MWKNLPRNHVKSCTMKTTYQLESVQLQENENPINGDLSNEDILLCRGIQPRTGTVIL